MDNLAKEFEEKAKCECEKRGGKWTQYNGYASWRECMDNNWPDDPPSKGPPVEDSSDLPPMGWIAWFYHAMICNMSACSDDPWW